MLCIQFKEAVMAKIETMTMREVDRLKTIQAVIDGELTSLMAAARLHLTKRQVNRLVLQYRHDGAAGLVRDSVANRVIANSLKALPSRH
jgi:hypothetical protein